MAFELPDLPYSHDALASGGMSEETLQYHHDLHHNAYITKANELIAGTDMEGKSLEDLITMTYQDPDKQGLFNQVSQAWNHNEFWHMMKPNGGGAMPPELESRIVADFGSVDGFKQAFTAAGAGQFGSGWVWLTEEAGKLKVIGTPNGVNPLCLGRNTLLGCDVWEHSYYIDYRNKRPAYLENFLEKLVNWENVAGRLSSV